MGTAGWVGVSIDQPCSPCRACVGVGACARVPLDCRRMTRGSNASPGGQGTAAETNAGANRSVGCHSGPPSVPYPSTRATFCQWIIRLRAVPNQASRKSQRMEAMVPPSLRRSHVEDAHAHAPLPLSSAYTTPLSRFDPLRRRLERRHPKGGRRGRTQLSPPMQYGRIQPGRQSGCIVTGIDEDDYDGTDGEDQSTAWLHGATVSLKGEEAYSLWREIVL